MHNNVLCVAALRSQCSGQAAAGDAASGRRRREVYLANYAASDIRRPAPPVCVWRASRVDRAKAAAAGARAMVCGHRRRPSGACASSYLVDPASSHMLVSKIKPCMSKYTPLHGKTANGSLNQLWFLRSYNPTWITVAILELIHATQLRPSGKSAFVSPKPIRSSRPVQNGDSEQLCADRMPLRRRRIFQMSALSTFDGTCYAYHGDNG